MLPLLAAALAMGAAGAASAATRAERERRRRIIRQVQRKLAGLRYDPGPVDGSWGGRTATALAAFQRDHDLKRTGRLTPQTLDRLLSATKPRRRKRRK